MLLNAIFKMASQHIGRYDTGFPAKPYLYHERLLQQLIPYLSENGRIDEATLVAAMFLRAFEEVHGTYSRVEKYLPCESLTKNSWDAWSVPPFNIRAFPWP